MTVKAPSLSLVCLYAREKGSPLKSLSAKLGILSQPKKSQVSLKIPFEDSPVKADMFWHSSVLTLYHAGTCSSWHFQKTLTSVFSQVKSAFHTFSPHPQEDWLPRWGGRRQHPRSAAGNPRDLLRRRYCLHYWSTLVCTKKKGEFSCMYLNCNTFS